MNLSSISSHHRPLRLGTRASRMALWQARRVAERLSGPDVAVELVTLGTTGDRDLTRPLDRFESDAPFADEIETALLCGQIDAAVHCLKDLSVRPTPGLRLAAMLDRDDPREVLVSRGNLKLQDLPPGSIVGTSSPRRSAQLLALRSDLRPRSVRGPVEQRVQQVRNGDFDALILAAAGLHRLGLAGEIAEYLDLDRFVPAGGQAVLVVQIRADDVWTDRLLQPLDHLDTRRAVTAELEFLRPFEGWRDITAAAFATAAGQVRLHGRLLALEGGVLWDGVVTGPTPYRVGRQAAACAAVQIDRIWEHTHA